MLNDDNKFSYESVETFADGQCIFEEGETGRDLFVVQSGEVTIRKNMNGKNVELARFKKGDFFGDMALLQSIPRYAGAYAVGETKLLVLKPGGFLVKIRRDPTFAFEMLQQLSMRVKVSNDRVMELVKRFSLPEDEVQKLLQELDGRS